MIPPMINNHGPAPWLFQKKAYEFIHYHGSVYLMLDMGMGKTRICIEANKQLDMPMFILGPKYAALETWPAEFEKWDPGAKYVVLHGKNKEQIWANSDKYTNIILNYDGLKWFYKTANKKLRPLQKYMFVFDEASMLKNSNTARWKILHDMMPIMSPYRVALSGTPVPNTMMDLWSQYFLLDRGRALGREFYQFKSRFFDYHELTYTTTIKPGMEQKIYDLVKPITMRLAAEDYLDLPDIVFNTIPLTLPQKLRKQYRQLEEEFMLEMKDGTIIANSEAVLGHKLRQFLQGGAYAQGDSEGSRCRLLIHEIKAQMVKQLMETNNGHPMLLAIQFRFEREILNKVMGYDIPHVTGETTAATAKKNIDDWNAGKLPLMVVHPKSVAYSLNLQHGGQDLIFAALPWELDLYQQLLKRLHRPGQTKTVFIHLLSFKNTVDGKVAKYLMRKDRTQEGLFQAITNR